MNPIDFKKWGYKKADDFKGLMPKVMELLGEQYCTGGSEEVLSIYDVTAKGVDQMEVVSPMLIALDGESESGDTPTPDPDPEPTPDPDPDPEPTPEPEPEHDFNRPDGTVNTPEEDATANSVIESALTTSASTAKVTVPEGEVLNNVTIPEEQTKFTYITGACQDGATITNNSPKGVSLTVTNEEPISLIIDGSSTATTTLHGQFQDIYSESPLSLSSTDKVYGTITFGENYDGNVNITADFQDGAMVQTMTHGTVTVSNQNGETDIEIYAPNASVVLKGKSDEVTATVADDTLYLDASSHSSYISGKTIKCYLYGDDNCSDTYYIETKEFSATGTANILSLSMPSYPVKTQ